MHTVEVFTLLVCNAPVLMTRALGTSLAESFLTSLIIPDLSTVTPLRHVVSIKCGVWWVLTFTCPMAKLHSCTTPCCSHRTQHVGRGCPLLFICAYGSDTGSGSKSVTRKEIQNPDSEQVSKAYRSKTVSAEAGSMQGSHNHQLDRSFLAARGRKVLPDTSAGRCAHVPPM